MSGASKLIRRLFHRLLPAHFIAAQLFSTLLLLWCCLLLSLLLAQHTSIWQLALCFSVLLLLKATPLWSASLTRFCSLRLALLGSTLLLSAHFFYSRLNSPLLCYFTLLVLNASVVAIAQNKETWRSSVLRWLRNFCMINDLSLLLLTFTNII